MKRIFILSTLVTTLFFLHVGAGAITLTKVAELHTAVYDYTDVFVQGNHAFIACGEGGIKIVDISVPTAPRQVAVIDYKDGGRADDIFIKGIYAYVADYDHGFHIFDISNPCNPFLTGHAGTAGDARRVMVSGDSAYVAAGDAGLEIIDVSNPANPVLLGSYKPQGNQYAEGVYVKDDYAYVADYYQGLLIIDVSNPQNPKKAGSFSRYTDSNDLRDVYVRGNLAFIAAGYDGLMIIDVTDPANPFLRGEKDTAGYTLTLSVIGEIVFTANRTGGMEVIDISFPSAPTQLAVLDTTVSTGGVFAVDGYTYLADSYGGIRVVEVSDPSKPTAVGVFFDTLINPRAFVVSGNYAYVGDRTGMDSGTIVIFDISDPAVPKAVSGYRDLDRVRSIQIHGYYAYLSTDSGLEILDVSNPLSVSRVGSYGYLKKDFFVRGKYIYSLDEGAFRIFDFSNVAEPVLVGTLKFTMHFSNLSVSGDYAYLGSIIPSEGVQIVDISDPASPVLTGSYNGFPAYEMQVQGNYVYMAATDSGLIIHDISDPANPSLVGKIDSSIDGNCLNVIENYAFLGTVDIYPYPHLSGDFIGVKVYDVSNPANITEVGSYGVPGDGIFDLDISGDYVYLTESEAGKIHILKIDKSTAPPRISLDRSELHLAAAGPTVSGPQTVTIGNSGGGTLNWSTAVDSNWLSCSPSSGTGGGRISISVVPGPLPPGDYSGAVTVSDPAASNSLLKIRVNLTVYESGHSAAPFGQFATPTGGTKVAGSIPVTGWALDDVGLQSVQIYRGDQNPQVYIGDAVFVEGARPDVAAAYPQYPGNTSAGWGYMLLTNYLPGNGNGTFTLHAVAVDLEGSQAVLGSKTIVCDNANAVNPFGAIETPFQGGMVSGSEYINWGWALTPQPNTIPTDGSTITVYVDSVAVGHPVYNVYREDISTLFPGCYNSGGAVGYIYLDTTQYGDGVHSIHWTVTDYAGNTDGIGSRYFTIYNGAQQKMQSAEIRGPVTDSETIFVETTELGRVQVALGSEESEGSTFALYNSKLPIGATLNRETGELSWIPGPGHLGVFTLRFIEVRPGGSQRIHKVRVTVKPKY